MSRQDHQDSTEASESKKQLQAQLDGICDRMAAILGGPEWDSKRATAKLDRLAQQYFLLLAVCRDDSLGWYRVRQIEAKDRETDIRRATAVLVVKKYEDQRPKTKSVLYDEDLTPEQKEAKLHEMIGV
jgi:hypothetical protein